MSFNVLIVDDSNSMRGVVKKVISMSGFKMDQCLEAENGKEALRILEQNWVDVILSDINMPEMNGLEFLEQLQKEELFKRIPVIIISTESREDRVREAIGLGAKAFIKKPFLPAEVKKVLYEVIGVDHGEEYRGDNGDDGDLDF